MTQALLALGISHHTAPLALRERLALPEGRASSVFAELLAGDSVQEAVAVSTCNRTELYLVTPDPVGAESAALAVLARQADIRPTELTDSLYARRDADAVRHLFSVAAGLDSMIIGEAEIQGQIKRAYELALVEGATGPISNRLFREALGAGKRVRTETGVGRAHVSVASVAVSLAARQLGDLTAKRVLVIGAGETGELTARALRASGVQTVFVANRHYDRAIGLAQRFGGSAVRLRGASRGAGADRHRRQFHRVAARDRGAGRPGADHAPATGTAAGDDRHRRAPRRRPRGACGPRRRPLRHGRPAAVGRPRAPGARGRGGARPLAG